MIERLAHAVAGPRGRWLALALWVALGVAGLFAHARIDDVTAAGQTSFLPSGSESTRALAGLQHDFGGGEEVPAVIIFAVFWLSTLKALYYGPLAALMAELLPAATRATGLGLGYNIGVTLFGGMGPATMTWLGGFALIGNLAPGYYLTAVAIISLGTLLTIRATHATSQEP